MQIILRPNLHFMKIQYKRSQFVKLSETITF